MVIMIVAIRKMTRIIAFTVMKIRKECYQKKMGQLNVYAK